MDSKSDKVRVPKGYLKLKGSERPRPSAAKMLGPLDPTETVSVTLVLRHKPSSPDLPSQEYWKNTPIGQRRFLSPTQYADTYGASQADLDLVTSFVTSHGMNVLNTHAGRRTVSISGTAALMNAAFGIRLNRYESPRPAQTRRMKTGDVTTTHIHHGYDGSVHIPAELADIVTAVIGLDNRALGGPGGSSGDPTNSNSLSVPKVANLYNFPNPGASPTHAPP